MTFSIRSHLVGGAMLLGLSASTACRDEEPVPVVASTAVPAAEPSASASAAQASAPSWPAALGEPATWARCVERRDQLLEEEDEAANAAFEAERLPYAARVRGATGWWKRLPAENALPEEVAEDFEEVRKAERPLSPVRRLVRRHRKHPERLRAALIREGYLFVEGAAAALAVVQQVGLQHLFEAERLYLLRNGEVLVLERRGKGRRGHYVHADGLDAGNRAEILFGDRVDRDRAALLRGPLWVSFASERDRLGFDRVRKIHLVNDLLAAEVRYGTRWLPVLFDVAAPEAKLQCHALEKDEAPELAEAFVTAGRQARVFRRLREVVVAQVREALPFDAPKGGGADDGDKYPLRARWMDAYAKGLPSFRYAGRRYEVFDAGGRPRVPQVCIDFVYDSWERSAGTWWPPRGDGATARTAGALSIDALGVEERRRVQHFLDFARSSPEHFDVWENPKQGRVLYTERDAFIANLQKHAEQFRRGDLLIVRRRRANGRALHHSLLVMETDPFLGVPTLLAGNSAVPRLQTFDGAMQITPRRFLEMRIRPQAEWFDAAVLKHLGETD